MQRRTWKLIWLGLLLVISTSLAFAQERARPTANYTAFLPIASGSSTPPPSPPIRTGQATYYNADGSGNCMFDATPNDLMVGAMNQTDYANAALCGAYVEITGPKGVITVRIVDRCPECPAGNIDLSQQAFARIADVAAGRVPITWRIVSPDISGPIRYRFKEGSSQWWTAVQVRNHRNPITKFEYRTAAGQWQSVPRTEYNYFVELSGMGPGPYSFRLTDMYGNVLTDTNISLQVGAEVAGSNQFPKQP